MPIHLKLQLATILAGVLTGCVLPPRMPLRRDQLFSGLEQELTRNNGWVQIHAADALLDHRETKTVREIFTPLAVAPTSPLRIGIWRVMARAAATGPQRAAFIEQLRGIVQDPAAPDRLQAAESLAKLGAVNAGDRAALQTWLDTANEATAPFVRWLLVLSASPAERPADETALTALLDSSDDIARLRAAFALGRLNQISGAAGKRLREQIAREPMDSIGRAYVIAASLRHADRNGKDFPDLKSALAAYLKTGKPGEQLEAATMLGEYGDAEDRPSLERVFVSTEPDARIGAASGLLYLQK